MCNGLRLRQIRCFVCQLSHAWQHRLSFGSTTIKINCCSSLKKTFTPVYHQLQKNHSFSTKKCPYTDSDRPQRMVLYPQDRFQSLLLLQIDLRQRCTCNSSTTIVRMSRTWFILLFKYTKPFYLVLHVLHDCCQNVFRNKNVRKVYQHYRFWILAPKIGKIAPAAPEDFKYHSLI